MFETDPLFRRISPSNLETNREARRTAAKSPGVSEAQIERELEELDAAIVGMDAEYVEALNEWAELSGPEAEEEGSGVVKRPR